jgi:hypothetical protein
MRKRNPLVDDRTAILVAVGVGLVIAIGTVIYASVAEASQVWPATQFGNGTGGFAGTIGTGSSVQLMDTPTGVIVSVLVTSVSGGMGVGVVTSAPTGASESVGDSVSFYVADVVA